MRRELDLAVSALVFTSWVSLATSCANAPKKLLEPAPPGTETIAIVGTNDLHGTLSGPSGIAAVGGAIRVLRQEWGSGMLWLDAGDSLSGSLESSLDQGQAMVAALNSAGLDAATLGNGDLLLDALPSRLAEAHYSILAANLVGRATRAFPAVPGQLPSRLFHVGSLQVGVIGLVSSSGAAGSRKIFASKYLATGAAEAVTREARRLREQGAMIVALVAHQGLDCDQGAAPAGHALRKASDPMGACSREEELPRLLLSLPAGTIDAVVSGESHRLIHHFVPAAQGSSRIPVVQGGGYGAAINVIYLSYDWTHHQLLPERTRIEGPIPIQEGYDFHGQRLDVDPQVEELAHAAEKRADASQSEVIARADRAIESGRSESALGDFAADSARHAVSADLALLTPGVFRAGLPQGKIRFADLWRAIPYESRVVHVDLTGDELLLLLKIATNGSRGFPSVSGLSLKVLSSTADAKGRDLNGDHHIDPWEIDRLIEARLTDGDEIQPKRTYRLATIDYLARGGDDLAWFFARIPEARFSHEPGPRLRDVLKTALTERARSGPVNSLAAPLPPGDSAGARYHFEAKRPTKAKHVKHRRASKKPRK
jgi:5'-nucleotidase